MFGITLKFLEAVQRNNRTERFHANYDLYQQEKKRFGRLVAELLAYGQELNPEWADLQVKNCVFRFNRDIRYRADKSPYKDHFGFEIAANGKRSGRPCFYFELRPGASFVGIGTFRAGDPLEHQIRRHAILHFDERRKIQTSTDFQKTFGGMLRSDPVDAEYVFQEYKSMYGFKKAFPNEDPAIEELSERWKELRARSYQKVWEIFREIPAVDQEWYRQLCFQKDWIWQVKIPEEILLSEDIVGGLKKIMEIGMPMIRFLQEGLL